MQIQTWQKSDHLNQMIKCYSKLQICEYMYSEYTKKPNLNE